MLFISNLLNVLLPSACIVCGKNTETSLNLCRSCLKSMPILPNHCPQCARFLPQCRIPLQKCGTCLRDPPSFDRTFVLFPYQGILPLLIAELKFQQKLTHAKLFADLFVQHIQQHWYDHQRLPDLILPIPLHMKRLQERGFNQAVEIARPIAKYLNIFLDLRSTYRSKMTKSQRGLKARARIINMANAFHCTRTYTGLSVALLDDVVTTTSTVSACAQILKNQGAEKVHIWAVARKG